MNPKEMTNDRLPTWGEIEAKDDAQIPLTKLEQFIYYNEPAGKVDEHAFRAGLILLVNEINNEVDALRKENEELRKLLGECPKCNNQLGYYGHRSKDSQIDIGEMCSMREAAAGLSKESEASHE